MVPAVDGKCAESSIVNDKVFFVHEQWGQTWLISQKKMPSYNGLSMRTISFYTLNGSGPIQAENLCFMAESADMKLSIFFLLQKEPEHAVFKFDCVNFDSSEIDMCSATMSMWYGWIFRKWLHLPGCKYCMWIIALTMLIAGSNLKEEHLILLYIHSIQSMFDPLLWCAIYTCILQIPWSIVMLFRTFLSSFYSVLGPVYQSQLSSNVNFFWWKTSVSSYSYISLQHYSSQVIKFSNQSQWWLSWKEFYEN